MCGGWSYTLAPLTTSFRRKRRFPKSTDRSLPIARRSGDGGENKQNCTIYSAIENRKSGVT
jgi:hypothetical protein